MTVQPFGLKSKMLCGKFAIMITPLLDGLRDFARKGAPSGCLEMRKK